MGGQVPVRTFADWNKPPQGFLEIDFVAHCGGPLSGSAKEEDAEEVACSLFGMLQMD